MFRPVAIAALVRCVTVVLAMYAMAPAAHAQFPWSTPDKQPQKKEPAAKPKQPAAEPKAAEPKAAQPAGSTDSQADLAFWNSIKDRGKPDELRAYLKQFPDGRFADLARLRLKEAEDAKAANIATGATGDGNVVREIQERLYKLNYPITRFDGSVDDATDRAIKAWQVRNAFAPSGVLTAAQLKVLRAIVPASTWGAIAHPIVGAPVTVHSKASRQEAESQALAACRSKNGVACKVVAAAAADCVTVANYRSKAPDGRAMVTHFYSLQAGTVASAQKVLQTCTAHPLRGANRCALVGMACGASDATVEQLNKLLAPSEPAKKPPQPLPQQGKGKEQET